MWRTVREKRATPAVSDADDEASTLASDDTVGSSKKLRSDANADMRFLMKRLSDLYPK